MESLHEEWRDIQGFEGKYQVSNLGNVRSLARWVKHPTKGRTFKQERQLAHVPHSGGYRTVGLGGRSKYIHRLVLQAFVGDPPKGKRDVNHVNGNKTDNRLENLEYCDRLHNVRHAIKTGLQDNAGEGNGMHKYTEEQIRHAFELVKAGYSQRHAARTTGVAESTIQQVLKGTRWRCLELAN